MLWYNDKIDKVSLKYIDDYENHQELDINGKIIEIEKKIIYASEHFLFVTMKSIEEKYDGLGKSLHDEIRTGITYLNKKAVYNAYLIFTKDKLFILRFDENYIPLDNNERIIEIENNDTPFFRKEKWLNIVKNYNIDFYNKIVNTDDIKFDFNTFSLIIEGVYHPIELVSIEPPKHKIINIDLKK